VYAPSVRAHSETVLRGFYDFHREAGTGPLVNPFPLDRSRRAGRAHAHHNPIEPYRRERSGLYRPAVPSRIPRSVPDEEFNEIFAALHSHRDRALVAFYVSTGARASELLSATRGGVDPGRQLITVVRKGTRELQQLPASCDAFVWLRLYQLEMDGLVPGGSGQPLWWTLRRPFRPLAYHAAHRMFERAGAAAGTDATLHSLRHTAAYRMAEDPALPLTDVQLVLGHALLTTTQLYLTPRKEDVIRRMLAHHAEQVRQARQRAQPAPAPGYRPESLDVLFGNGRGNRRAPRRAWRRRCGCRVTRQRGPGSRRGRRPPGGRPPRRLATRWQSAWPACCPAMPGRWKHYWPGCKVRTAAAGSSAGWPAAPILPEPRGGSWRAAGCTGGPGTPSRRWPRWSRPWSRPSAPTSCARPWGGW
jgi:integrase